MNTSQSIPYGREAKTQFPFRLFIALFLPVALLIFGGAWYVGQKRIEAQLSLIDSNEVSKVVLGVRRLDGGMQVPLRQFRTLTGLEAVQRAINDNTPDSASGMVDAFSNLVTYNPMVDQVRWIDETGMERVRVDNTGGHPATVARDQLQNKADRYYFVDTMRLKPGEIYMSPLDLNEEHDKVEVPYRPMVRLATRVSDRNGQPRGIVIANVAAQQLLDGFTESVVDNRDHVMLVNSEGYWLVSPKAADEWGFMFHRNETMLTRYPDAWKAISRLPVNQMELANGLWTWSTVYPLKVGESAGMAGVPYWYVISHLPHNFLAMVRSEAWQAEAIVAIIVLAVTGLGAVWLAMAIAGRKRAAIDAARAQAKAEEAQRLYEAQQRFQSAVMANVNGALVIDAEGHIVMANPALERMFGYEPGELLGQDPETLLPEADRVRHVTDRRGYMQAPVARAMGTGRDLYGRRKDGSVFLVEISLSPFTDNGKQYVDAIVADISERKRIETLREEGDSHPSVSQTKQT